MLDTISMADGTQVKTLDELREHFDLVSVLEHYTSGKLLEWLESQGEQVLAQEIASLNPLMEHLEAPLCSILQLPFSPEEAVAAYEARAEQGSVEACYRLGCCYLTGYGLPSYVRTKTNMRHKKNRKRGAELTEQAAMRGHAAAQYRLAECYRKGIGRNVDMAGYAKWMRKAAEHGCVQAQYKMGRFYSCKKMGKDENGIKIDKEETARWYLRAAAQGHQEAQLEIGYCFFNGEGVAQNYDEAIKWFRQAAEQGSPYAICQLSICHFAGCGVEKDEQTARKLFRSAVEKWGDGVHFTWTDCYHRSLYGLKEETKNLEELFFHPIIIDRGIVSYEEISAKIELY